MCGNGRAKIIALGVIAVRFSEEIKLLDYLYPFGSGFVAKVVRQGDNGLRYLNIISVLRNITDEGAIDLNERALGIFENILKNNDGCQQRMQLAMTYNNTARTYHEMNRFRYAIRCYNRGIEVFNGINRDHLDSLDYKKGSLLFMNKANVLFMTQENRQAIQ